MIQETEKKAGAYGSCKSDIKTIPSKKYIMESYFEKYDSLPDSNFQEFLALESPSGLCKSPSDDISLGLRVSVLKRFLDGEGAHRRLSSSIRLDITPDSLTDFSGRICEILIIERLPYGVFADPFELQHLTQRGVFTEVEVFGDTNLELPTVTTNRSAVEVHMNVESDSLNKNGLEIKIELPLHSRYPPLVDSGYTKVTFESPDLFMRCNESCILFPAKDYTKPETGDVAWRVPSGRESHCRIVSAATFICALLSTLVIVFASMYHPETKTVKLC